MKLKLLTNLNTGIERLRQPLFLRRFCATENGASAGLSVAADVHAVDELGIILWNHDHQPHALCSSLPAHVALHHL